MKTILPEKQRIAGPPGAPFGRFLLKYSRRVSLLVQLSDGLGWQHASVSAWSVRPPLKPQALKRCPTWDEMGVVKDAFWLSDEWVVQYHPAKKEYVTCHPYVLHLWKPTDQDLPTPDAILVGPKGITIDLEEE
jgi:hypothetical protein